MRHIALPATCYRSLPSHDEYIVGDRLLKVSREQVPEAELERQKSVLRHAAAAGLARCGSDAEVVRVGNGRLGQLFVHHEGPLLADVYQRRPLRMRSHAQLLAEQHRRIHAHGALAGLPDQHDILKDRLLRADGIDGAMRRRLVAILQRLPRGANVCHGDFQPYSVQLTAAGPLVMHWKNACNGHWLGDIARSLVIMGYTVEEQGFGARLLRNYLRLNNAFYLSACLRGRRDQARELPAWLAVNAAARLAEDVPEKPRLLRLIRRRLARLDSA